jgi:hypothetical protein
MADIDKKVMAGLHVQGADGASVGQIKEVRQDDFLVDRHMQHDIYIPFDAVKDVSGNQVLLDISANQVDNMGWPTPESPLSGTAPHKAAPR